jgi:hypothetical protein
MGFRLIIILISLEVALFSYQLKSPSIQYPLLCMVALEVGFSSTICRGISKVSPGIVSSSIRAPSCHKVVLAATSSSIIYPLSSILVLFQTNPSNN